MKAAVPAARLLARVSTAESTLTDQMQQQRQVVIEQNAGECWAIAQAEKLALVVDGADYFRAAKEAMLSARHSIMLIGWDFDARTELEPGESILDGPSKVGPFLNWLAKHRPELSIRLLKWDTGLIRSLCRGETPLFMLNWLGQNNVRFRLDGAHPKLAAHHMKLLVVDDAIAFCGGIDMTVGRWDTREHREGDERRRSPWGRPLGPWHDATTCVSGPIAARLGELARERWKRGTGETLKAPPPTTLPWPESLAARFDDVSVCVARTVGHYKDYPQVSEIEAVTLRLIRTAKSCLYIESQYLASRKIAAAIAQRLKESDGPEIVVINPDSADGWLEAKAMDSARSRLLNLIRKADRHDRFRCFYPVNAAGTPIYVHAKVMIADDRFLKIGSANLNNRSMGYDTECDLLIEAQRAADPESCAAGIASYRNSLLAEHLRADQDTLSAAASAGTGLLALIDRFNSGTRRLVPLESKPLSPDEEVIAETDLVDPERPSSTGRQLLSIFS